jgi:hypothetical protein
MKKYTLILLVYISLSAKSQVVNRFRDSTWFAKSVRFDSAIYLIKGASNGKVLTSDAYGRATWQSASGGVSQSALDDSINSVRSIRKVDTLYKNLDSIIYKINGIRYAIKDSSGGLTDSTIFATKNYVNSLNGSNATITSLNDSITSVRNIRKVDTLYRNLDSIIYKINSIRYAIKDSTGGGADSQSLHLAFSDSIELSITRGNSIKFAYAIDSVSLITDSLIVFKGGVRKSYVKNTVSFAKNTAKDSIILTLNGNRYAVKDSIGSGGGASLNGLTAATATNSINNADYSQEWNWSGLSAGTKGMRFGGTDILVNGITVGLGRYQNASNVALGLNALVASTNCLYNTAIGSNALNKLTTGLANTAIGENALSGLTTGLGNIGIGRQALNATVSGADNIGIGNSSLTSMGTAYGNVAIGVNALYHLNTGNFNVAIGNNALVATKGGNNIGIGYSAGSNLTTGTNNTIVGYYTGLGITTGSKNTIIGANISGLATSLSNTIILADGDGVIRYYCNSDGSTGIGTSTPNASAKLDVSSTTQGVLLPRMTTTQKNAISSPAEGLEVYDLTLHQKSYYNGTTWINY